MKIAHRLLLVLLIGIFFFGCGGKKSGIEGKVVDGVGQPISGLKVMIKQVQPVKGYEQFDTTTGSDGIFRFPGVMPVSEYVISLLTDKWKTKVTTKVTSGTEGQTLVLNSPILVRFNVMRDGSVVDTKTGLQWLIYNGTDLSAENVINNVKNIREGGFADWKLPTISELNSLQEKATASGFLSEIDAVHEACCVWTGEPNTDNVEWSFYIDDGNDLWTSSTIPANDRILVVRSAGGVPTAVLPPVVTPPPSNLPPAAPAPPVAPVVEKKIAPTPEPAKVTEKKEVAAPVKEPAAKKKEIPPPVAAPAKVAEKKEAAASTKEPVVKKKEAIALQQPTPAKKEPAKKTPVAVKEESAVKPASLAKTEPAPLVKAEPSPMGNNIILYFGVNSVSVSAEDLAKLKSFYAKTKGNTGRLVIEGHSDSSGSSSGKLKISSDRALSVYDTLIKLGLSDKVAVEIKSMGSAKPAGENDSAEGRKLNRRVEVTFIP
jgi:outer membrane protein OmpA-like peptidoglycan-associated protein